MATIGFKAEGDAILLLDYRDSLDSFLPEVGQSLWLREVHDREDGDPPKVDLEGERRVGDYVRKLIADNVVSAVHDVSDGGPLVAVTEMALAGNIGAELDFDTDCAPTEIAAYFSERQGVYVVSFKGDWLALSADAKNAGVSVSRLGTTVGNSIRFVDDSISYDTIEGLDILLSDLRAAHESFFKDWMES